MVEKPEFQIIMWQISAAVVRKRIDIAGSVLRARDLHEAVVGLEAEFRAVQGVAPHIIVEERAARHRRDQLVALERKTDGRFDLGLVGQHRLGL